MNKSKMDQQKFLDDLKTFISFRTISKQNPEEFDKLYGWVRSFFDGVDVELKEFESNGVKSMVIKPRESKKPHILGLGHIDVVPAPDELFEIKEKDGWVFGRGVSDMKTQDLIMMYVLKERVESGNHNDFWIALTGDEEVGGLDGAKVIIDWLEKECLMPEIAFIPDGGNNFEYVESEKGVAFCKAVAKGTAAHGSKPWLGENAIDKILNFYTEAKKAFPNPKNEDDWKISFSMTKINGGSAMNKIPEECVAEFDVRITERETPEKFLSQLSEIAEKYDVKIEPLATGPSYYSPCNSEIAKKFIDVIEEVVGKKVKISRYTGASDGRFLMGKNVNLFMTHMNNDASIHKEDERCETESVWVFCEIVTKMVDSF